MKKQEKEEYKNEFKFGGNYMNKKLTAFTLATTIMLSGTITAFADASPGDVYLTLGEDLTIPQKEVVYSNLQVEVDISENQIIYVTNEEEHKYLGEYIPKTQIGSKALSSSKITVGEKDSGLLVNSDENINYISEEMYLNALSTAGVKDVNVEISAPFQVSGTAALTGIIKAYEASTGVEISEEQKQIANEEMITTAKISEEIGSDELTGLINQIKEEIGKNPPANDEELAALIKRLAEENGINLTDEQITQLVGLFNKIQNLDIDWEKVNNTLESAKDKWNEFSQTEGGQGLIQGFIDFIGSIVDAIGSFFSK
jgi:uncharacterized protein YpuA (DUF1002 family)